jgi:hypothetical protein
MAAAQAHGMAGVVATGVPEGGYDGPQAEKLRQDRFMGSFQARDPELVKAFIEARAAARAAMAHYDAMRLRVAAAVGPGFIHDVLAVVDRDLSEAEKRQAEASVLSLGAARAPDYAYSEAEQVQIREQRRKDLEKPKK